MSFLKEIFRVRASLRPSLLVGVGILLASATPAQAQSSQSPVDITPETTRLQPLPALTFNYSNNADLRLVNTGSPGEEATVRADVAPGAGVFMIGSDSYNLLQFHVHIGCEHKIEGLNGAMELHFVHRALNGELAVVGRILTEGDENPLLARIFDGLPQMAGDTANVTGFDIAGLLPSSLESFRYSGSLTTSPFAEPVRWTVLATPLSVSARQIGQFRALFPEGNAREVQPLNGRIIATDVAGFAAVPEPQTWAMMIVGFGAIGFAMRRRQRIGSGSLAIA
jgi:carbonic anhydrase